MPKYTGSAQITDADYRYLKYVGKTKGGAAVAIELPACICRSNPDWAFAEKNDTTAELEFEGVYDDDKLESGDFTEPWSIDFAANVSAGNGEIILGVGKLYIGTSKDTAVCVGLSRGGGKFSVERTLREINADNDPGAVKGRIEKTEGRPKLKLTALQWLTKLPTIYPAIKEITEVAEGDN